MAHVNAIKTIMIVGKVKKEVKTEEKNTGGNNIENKAGGIWKEALSRKHMEKEDRANQEVNKDQHRDHSILVWSKVMAQVKRHRFKSLSVQVSFSSPSFFTFLLSILTACQNEQRDCQSECTTIVISFPVNPTIC